MIDFGNPEERAVALDICIACEKLNEAISRAQRLGMFVKIADIACDDHESNLVVRCMQRRTIILPAPRSLDEVAS